ncbi:MAG: FecR domain-containing protein [Deltaproteobacteria bacterium]|nr:FecR domain-containing protein [Candidatus Zymogenaceae bacterium]
MLEKPAVIRRIMLLCALIAALSLFPSGAVGEGILEGSVIDVFHNGYFFDESTDSWNRVVSGMYLLPGHRLKTSEKGTMTLFMDGKHLVRLDPDTEIRIADFAGIGGVEVLKEYDKSRIVVEVVRGCVSCSASARPADHGFALISGAAVAVPADDGAEFSLSVLETTADTGEVRLVVREGEVRFMTVDGHGGSVGEPVVVGPEMSSVVSFIPKNDAGPGPSEE